MLFIGTDLNNALPWRYSLQRLSIKRDLQRKKRLDKALILVDVNHLRLLADLPKKESPIRKRPLVKICPQAFFRFLSPCFFIFSRAVFRAVPQLTERLRRLSLRDKQTENLF